LVLGMISLTFVTINSAGGVASIFETSKDWKLFLPASDPDFPWTMYLGGLLCISVFYNATNQFIVQRALAAKNEWHARMGVIFGNYLKFVLPILIIAPALVAAKLFPGLDKPDLVFPVLVKELLPASLVGIVMAALVSAVMSHISGAINSSTTIITMDIYLPYIRKNASESESVRFGRIAGILVIVLGVLSTILLIRFSDKPIFLHLLNAYGLFTPGVATMFLMGILWKRTTNAGAMTAAVLSVPLSFIIEAWFPGMSFLNRTGIVFWVCVVICGFVSVCTKPKPTQELEGLIWDRKSVSLPVELSRYNRGVRNPMIWWALITLIILFFYIKYA
ncbi:MAG TPA: sodium transporter, partial [Ginsengibacter sp.]|nr:sodium transporter [Ginsengibacter sp.]